MTEMSIDVDGWLEWTEAHRSIGSKLSGANRVNMESYFLTAHAATEVMFRRILLVGLRLNKVTYREANEWLYHNDDTPEKIKYPILFDRLYITKNVTWIDVIQFDPELRRLWELWLGYSKVIRNHISHGIRKYSDDWLLCGITIDQELLIRLDQALVAKIGGSVCAYFAKFNPRLPIGTKGKDLKKITGRRPRTPRPPVSLANAKIVIEGLIPRVR